jgi:hypothetical protein
MRIGKILDLTPADIEDRKLTLRGPKSGKEREIVFIPQNMADCLKEYITGKELESDRQIFPISYATRRVVNKAEKVVGIHLGPNDLKKHTATATCRFFPSMGFERTAFSFSIVLKKCNASCIRLLLFFPQFNKFLDRETGVDEYRF